MAYGLQYDQPIGKFVFVAGCMLLHGGRLFLLVWGSLKKTTD